MNYRRELKNQLSFIENSCSLYDAGSTHEALRIAVALRVIFHDTRHSISLMTLLERKDSMRLMTTIGSQLSHQELIELKKIQPQFVMIHKPLMLTQKGVTPLLDKYKSNEVAVTEKWWNELVLINRTFAYSRKDIVLAAANQDGGAHIDPKPSSKTKELKSSQGKHSINNRPFQEITEHHLPLLRQMGYEVLNSKMMVDLAKDT